MLVGIIAQIIYFCDFVNKIKNQYKYTNLCVNVEEKIE